MPDQPDSGKHAHPINLLHRAPAGARGRTRSKRHRYAELRCKSNFSFLRGASHPEELAQRAAELGYAALAIADRNTLAGVVRMHCAAKACGLELIVGAELTPVDAAPITLYAPDRASYGRLARIITQGRRRAVKGACKITLADIVQWSDGLLATVHGVRPSTEQTPLNPPLARGEAGCPTSFEENGCPISFEERGGGWIPPKQQASFSPHHPLNSPSTRWSGFSTPAHGPELTALVGGEGGNLLSSLEPALRAYRDIFGERLYLAVSVHGGPDDERHLAEMDTLARAVGVPMVATNDVHYHETPRRFLQDVLTCIRERCTLEAAGQRLFANAERHLKPVEEMQRLFAAYPRAIARTMEIADRCSFSLDQLRYEYPEAICPPDKSPPTFLAELTRAGARERYPDGIPPRVRVLIEHELKLIRKLAYEPYFLTVHDIVEFARSRDILCQGRGSAANSAVCYCLGITAVDPNRIDLLFERFVSAERNEPPDIDVDFEHERREEVFQYIYDKYGRDHAGIVAEVISYRPRSAIRDVGKVLGLSLDRVTALAKKHEWWDKEALQEEAVREIGFDPADRTVRMLGRLVNRMVGFPRHLSQHVGGFVITRGPLCEMVPIENGAMPDRTFIEWDKDDIDALGILKIDCLALGMLTAIHKCFEMIEEEEKGKGSRDRGIKGSRTECGEKEHVEKGNVSRSHCVEESDCFVQTGLSGVANDAGRGEIRAGVPDEACGGLGGQQYRRGKRPSVTSGLPSFSDGGPRFFGRAGNTVDYCGGTPDAPRIDGGDARHPGDQAHPPRPHRQSAKKAARTRTEDLTPERGSKPCLSKSSISRSLDPSIPRSLQEIPPEDPAVYDMICRADTVGVFQIESRAQMSMLPRLRPREYYDLVIEVAIVRPGPIQGGMVHPYLRRRNGEEPITYPNEAIKEVLEKTLGVPLFQEQAMRLAVVAAGFTPGEADQLRRAMGAWRRHGVIDRFRTRLIDGMKANGLAEEFAQRCFEQISGFGEYGFPESHAASFALLVYVSAWLKRYYPAAFCAAIINSQPMGFYHPAQLVRDAREHGVPVLPVDVNFSGYDCRLEESGQPSAVSRPQSAIRNPQSAIRNRWGVGGPAVRLGLRLIKGISPAQVEDIERAQAKWPFNSVADLAYRSGASRATLAHLAAADAMRSLGLDRRKALWQVLALGDEPPLLEGSEPSEADPKLPKLSLGEIVFADYETTGLSLNAHPMSLIRRELKPLRVSQARVLKHAKQGQWLRVAGLVLVRQRPGTAAGIVFGTLEDETGTANLIIRPHIYEKYRRAAHGAVALLAEGKVERQGDVVHLQTTRLQNLSHTLANVRSTSRDFR